LSECLGLFLSGRPQFRRIGQTFHYRTAEELLQSLPLVSHIDCTHETHLARPRMLRERAFMCVGQSPIDCERDLHFLGVLASKHEPDGLAKDVVPAHDSFER
jgi:hypothetical protein